MAAKNPPDSIGYKIRLLIRLGRSLSSDELSRVFEFDGRQVTFKSQVPDEILKKAKWVVLGARGFHSEAEAVEFGAKLRRATEIAGFCAHVGVDSGNDVASSWVNEAVAKEMGFLKPHERLAQNVHGLMVLPDDENTRFPILNISAYVSSDPDRFFTAIAQLDGVPPIQSPAALQGLHMLNAALINPDSLAQIVLVFAAIEALGQDENWSEGQKRILEDLAKKAEMNPDISEAERTEVAEALRRGTHRIGLNQGVRRVLTNLGLDELKKPWAKLYARRSGVVHGTSKLSPSEISSLATDALKLCGAIILVVLEKEGIRLPEFAKINFPAA